MKAMEEWQPEITVTPVTSMTLSINVIAPVADNRQLAARLYPTDEAASSCQLLQELEDGSYAATFSTESQPNLDGYLHLWVQEKTNICGQPQDGDILAETILPETVVGYTVGGNPAHRRSRRTLSRAGGAHRRSRRVSAISGDGQVLLYGDTLDTEDDSIWFFTIQATSTIPDTPPGRTRIGQAYRLSASDTSKLADTSISFGYLGDQVPPGEETFLRLYFWDTSPDGCGADAAPCWRPLQTFRDTQYNVVSAKTQGPGLYALMSSMEIPLSGPGWNNFAYTLQEPQPVGQALASIDGAYTVVYGHQSGDSETAWRVYGPSAPAWVNDLDELKFGQGYWIHTTEAIILYLSGQETARAASVGGLTPPATYYGTLIATDDFTPQIGTQVTAWIDNKQCGQTETKEMNGQVVFAVKVAADDGGLYDGCGVLDRTVTFEIDGMPKTLEATWDNRHVRSLTSQMDIYLPIIVR